MWCERLWQVTVTLTELRLHMAVKLQPYHANKGRSNGGKSRRCFTRSWAVHLSAPLGQTLAPHLPHPPVIFQHYELASVLERASAKEHWHINTFIWNATKQVQEEEVDSSYTEALFQSELSRHIYWADNINQTQWTIVNKKTEKRRHQFRFRTAPDFEVCQAF